ncbi:MAG: GreA/GreB family elongation factor [Pseudomonadota bacterium]
MHSTATADRTITELDYVRLKKLGGGNLPAEIADCLELADLVLPQAIGPDRVSMYSQVEIEDAMSASRQKLVLCYPNDAEPAAGFVSVLSPVGASLLGLRLGATACWKTPNGDDCRAKVTAILFQPEASGDYTS